LASIEHDVHAVAAGGVDHFRRVAILRVVQHDRGAGRSDGGATRLAAGGADDAQAEPARQLHGCEADGSACAVHEDRFTGAHRGAKHERAIRRRGRDTERGALRERHRLGDRVHQARGNGHLLAIRAEPDAERGDVDPIAGRNSGHARADLLDDARAVGAGRVRQFRQARVLATAHVGVNGVHPGRVNADDHLTLAWLRIRDLDDAHDVGLAELLNANRAHPASIEQVRGGRGCARCAGCGADTSGTGLQSCASTTGHDYS
jgi:hypothetical protein